MAVFVRDTMTDTPGRLLTAHVGEVGATWTVHPLANAGSALITSANRLRGDSTNEALFYASGVPGSAEYDVTGTYHVVSNSVTNLGICGRMSPAANECYMAQWGAGSGNFFLFRRVNGSFTSLGSWTHTFPVGTTFTMRLEIRNATKKLFIDGVERISSADNTITAAGRAGIWSQSGMLEEAGYHLDEFVADDLTSSGLPLPLAVHHLAQQGML